MNMRCFHIISFLIVSLLILPGIPAVLAGGAGAGFGDYGDFGVSEGARMAADPYYPSLMAGSTNLTKPTVMTPLPTVSPGKVNTSGLNVSTRSKVSLDTTTTAGNQTVNTSVPEGKENQTLNSSVGDLIKAGDWNALDAYNARMRTDNGTFMKEDEMARKLSQSSSQGTEDDTVTTVVYPCS